MIYFFLCAIILMYLFILFKSRNVNGQFTSRKLYLFIILFLSVITVYIFSLSYDLSNTADYKQIHSKNMSVRNNIKTIRENIPKLESRLINSSDDFNGWLMLGKSYSILKNYQKASKAYQIAINLRPDNMDALREYILVLRSDGEIVNKDLIEKYFVIYIDKTNEPQALLDLLSFSFNVNDNLLAQNTLNEIIQHPNIANKNEYKKLLTNLKDSSGLSQTILDLSVTSRDKYEGYFFMILKEKDINQPFAIKRVKISSANFNVKFTSNDFMVKENTNIPNDFEFIIKHSKSDRFSSDVNLIEVFRMNISDYNSVKKEILRVTF